MSDSLGVNPDSLSGSSNFPESESMTQATDDLETASECSDASIHIDMIGVAEVGQPAREAPNQSKEFNQSFIKEDAKYYSIHTDIPVIEPVLRHSSLMKQCQEHWKRGGYTNTYSTLPHRKQKRRDRKEAWEQRNAAQKQDKEDKQEKPKLKGHKDLKDDFFEDVCHADTVLYEARQQTYQCDGKELPLFDAAKMCEGIRKEWGTRKTHWFSRCVAEYLAYHSIPEDKLRELPDAPFVIRDSNGVPLVWNLPGYFRNKERERYTGLLLELGEKVKLSTEQADKDGRGSNYKFWKNRLVGCINTAYAWVPMLSKQTELHPSAGIVNGGNSTSANRSALGFHYIQEHFSLTRKIATLVNYSLFRCHPASFWAHLQMSAKLCAGIPSACAVATHDPALLSSKSYIYSRATPVHFDNKEAPEGWLPLVVMGDCQSGNLALPRLRLGVKFSYLPGALVLVRGRIVDHGVTDWEGEGMRICVAHFNHISEWKFTGVIPPLV